MSPRACSVPISSVLLALLFASGCAPLHPIGPAGPPRPRPLPTVPQLAEFAEGDSVRLTLQGADSVTVTGELLAADQDVLQLRVSSWRPEDTVGVAVRPIGERVRRTTIAWNGIAALAVPRSVARRRELTPVEVREQAVADIRTESRYVPAIAGLGCGIGYLLWLRTYQSPGVIAALFFTPLAGLACAGIASAVTEVRVRAAEAREEESDLGEWVLVPDAKRRAGRLPRPDP
jgi:hypothetical protein